MIIKKNRQKLLGGEKVKEANKEASDSYAENSPEDIRIDTENTPPVPEAAKEPERQGGNQRLGGRRRRYDLLGRQRGGDRHGEGRGDQQDHRTDLRQQDAVQGQQVIRNTTRIWPPKPPFWAVPAAFYKKCSKKIPAGGKGL